MRFRQQRNILAALALGCILTALAGCASKQPAASPPAKPPVAVQAMVDVQKVLEAHPLRGKLRQMEQELAAADAYEVSDYKRVRVALASGLTAWVYVQA